MENKISVIIPVYNSLLTIKECLDSVFNSSFNNFEVVIVLDGSSDNSVEIARNYKCKIIELKQNEGPANARNVGANSAEGNILFFVDSDVIINENSLNLINNTFNNKEINVVQGVYSHAPNYKSILTQYQQSFYCYYTWHKNLKYVSTFTTMCCAMRKEIFLSSKKFNTKIKRPTAEDEEFGLELIDMGNKILILRELKVEHRVNYTALKFMKRNFILYFDSMKMYLKKKNIVRKFKQSNYSYVIMAIPLLALIMINLITMIFVLNTKVLIAFLLLNIIFFSLHLKFISFVASSKGSLIAFGIMITCYLDAFLMLAGATCACLSSIFGKKN